MISFRGGSTDVLAETTALVLCCSAFVLAETSFKAPRNIFLLITQKNNFLIKVSKKILYLILKRSSALLLSVTFAGTGVSR